MEQDRTIAQAAEQPIEEEPLPEIPAADPPGPGMLERLFSAETGPGDIDSYMHDPLNLTDDKGGAQVARGLTGLLNLGRLAIIDLVVGGVRIFLAARKRGATPDAGS